MADIVVSGNTKVKTLKAQFQEKYGVAIRVYKGQKFADDDATLASVRKDGVSGKGEIDINGNMHVGNLERKFMDNLGVKIQVENKAGKLADNNVSLASLCRDEAAAPTSPSQSFDSSASSEGAKKGCMGLVVAALIPVFALLYFVCHSCL